MSETKTAAKIKDEFVEFLKMYEENGELKYRKLISQMALEGKKSIKVSFQDILSSNLDLATDLQRTPREYLPIFKEALLEALAIENPGYGESQRPFIHVRITDMSDDIPLRNLTYEHLKILISTEGLVTRASEIIPLPVVQVFQCSAGHSISISNRDEDLKVKPPYFCTADRCDSTLFVDNPEKSVYTDFEALRLQEPMEDMDPGQLPHFLDVNLSYDLVRTIMPGDRVKIAGYLEVYQETKNAPSKRYRIHCISAERKDAPTSAGVLTKEEEQSFFEFAARPGSYDRLIASIAPSVFGHEMEKEACLLLLAGSPSIVLGDGIRLRGNINVLIAGDPGISKTTLLTYVAKISPRGIYTNGKTSSSAGLCAAVVRDKNNMFMLEAGATVLGDLGVTSIDEMSRMRPEDRDALHEVMEQNTVSIAKGGFVATLNARTSVLGATNPVFGKWDPYKNLIQNLSDFPIPLLNRFDLLFVIRDEMDEVIDSKIADHILAIRSAGRVTSQSIPTEFLKKYISFAKTISPELTEEVRAALKEEYLKMRRSTNSAEIPYNPRFLESMTRLSIARARILLHRRVAIEDARRAIALVNQSLRSALVDTTTNKIDAGLLYGKPISERSLMEFALKKFAELEGSPQKTAVNDSLFVQELVKSGKFTNEGAEKMFKAMCRSGQIYAVSEHNYRMI